MSAPTAARFVRAYRDELAEFAAFILRRHRAFLWELELRPEQTGVVLRGRARSFYGKQLAQQEVMRRGHLIVANHIEVGAPPAHGSVV